MTVPGTLRQEAVVGETRYCPYVMAGRILPGYQETVKATGICRHTIEV